MHPLVLARSRAYLVDCLGHLLVPAALVPVGLLIRRRHPRLDQRLLLTLSAVPPVVATLTAAVQESGAGSRGHRSQGLAVLTRDGAVPSFPRALLRSTVKIGAPWQLGHLVALGAAAGRLDRRHRGTVAATVVLYSWLAVAVATVATGSGRGLQDRAAHTSVVGR